VSRRRLVIPLLLALFLLASGIAGAQSDLDFSLPSSFSIAATKAYDTSYNTPEVSGNIDVFNYGEGVYVTIPTNSTDGAKLMFFQDTSTWAIFRNNTLVLPIKNVRGQSANFVLATGDLNSSGGKFYGRVTGIELDSSAVNSGDASVVAALYLNDLPDGASYRLRPSAGDEVKKALLGQASKDGQQGDIKFILEVSGTSPGSQGSIAYAIVRMKPGGMIDGNVTAYRYYGGTVSQLPCKAIRSENGMIYETLSPGPGTFAFIGPAVEVPPMLASLNSTMIFAGVLFAVLIALVIGAVRILKKRRIK
jgi:hypothetical protein